MKYILMNIRDTKSVIGIDKNEKMYVYGHVVAGDKRFGVTVHVADEVAGALHDLATQANARKESIVLDLVNAELRPQVKDGRPVTTERGLPLAGVVGIGGADIELRQLPNEPWPSIGAVSKFTPLAPAPAQAAA